MHHTDGFQKFLIPLPPFSYWLKLCFLPPCSPVATDGASSSFRTHLSPLFVPLLLPCLLFILMWSEWSSWWWHGVDYAVPTVTFSKAAEEGAVVVCDLWMTALPVAPAPHWQLHGVRGAGASVQGRVQNRAQFDRYVFLKGIQTTASPCKGCTSVHKAYTYTFKPTSSNLFKSIGWYSTHKHRRVQLVTQSVQPLHYKAQFGSFGR